MAGHRRSERRDGSSSGWSPRGVRSSRDEGSDEWELVASATAEELALSRRDLRRWLESRRWPVDEADDLVLAVNEAMSNVVEHAYPPAGGTGHPTVRLRGTVEVDRFGSADDGTRRVQVTIDDTGRWRADVHDRTDRGRPRGRGFDLMENLMDEVHIVAGARGTRVELVSPAVPSW